MEFVKEIKCPHCGSVDVTTSVSLDSFAKREVETFGHCYECLKDLKFNFKATRYDLIDQDAMLLEYNITARAFPDMFRTKTISYNPVTGENEIAISEYYVTSIEIIEDYPDKHY